MQPRHAIALLAALGGLLAAGCQQAPPPSPWDGRYAGRALLAAGGGAGTVCALDVPLWPMTVRQGYVDFGCFQGWVTPDGRVALAGGVSAVTGRFSGDGQFEGSLSQPIPTCQYAVRMERIGA